MLAPPEEAGLDIRLREVGYLPDFFHRAFLQVVERQEQRLRGGQPLHHHRDNLLSVFALQDAERRLLLRQTDVCLTHFFVIFKEVPTAQSVEGGAIDNAVEPRRELTFPASTMRRAIV